MNPSLDILRQGKTILEDDVKCRGRLNEIKLDLVGMASGLNPDASNVAGARGTMLGGQVQSRIITSGHEPNPTFSGAETEYAKATFYTAIPCDARIISVIQIYPTDGTLNTFKENPETIVIYEDLTAKQNGSRVIDAVSVKRYTINDPVFGYDEKINHNAMSRLSPDAYVPKDTKLSGSPAVTDDGDWAYGTPTLIALMTLKGVAEDSWIISESYAAKKLKTVGYAVRHLSIGEREYPKNLHGNDDIYKILPDIGEYVNTKYGDDLLFAKATMDDDFTLGLTKRKTQTFNFNYGDTGEYIPPGCKVVDIRVLYDGGSRLPDEMTAQLRKYLVAHDHSSRRILSAVRDYKRKYPDTIIGHKLNTLYRDALHYTRDRNGKKKVATHRRAKPVGTWSVEVVLRYEMSLIETAKLAGLHGNKGVVGAVWPDCQMPTDKFGRVADLIGDPDSIAKRMNYGVTHELSRNNYNWHVAQYMREAVKRNDYEAAWLAYVNFLYAVYPEQDYYDTPIAKRKEYVDAALAYADSTDCKLLRVHCPTDNPVAGDRMIRRLRKLFGEEVKSPVRYSTDGVRYHTTVDDVEMGHAYFIHLEKIGDDWAATSTPRLQALGFLAKLTDSTRGLLPYRDQATRAKGEDEVRSDSSVVGPEAIREQLLAASSADVQRVIAKRHLKEGTPIIDNIYDRNNPNYRARGEEIMSAILKCSGTKITR